MLKHVRYYSANALLVSGALLSLLVRTLVLTRRLSGCKCEALALYSLGRTAAPAPEPCEVDGTSGESTSIGLASVTRGGARSADVSVLDRCDLSWDEELGGISILGKSTIALCLSF